MGATTIEWYETAGRLLLAAALGGALGLEREFDGQDAGFRTHVLVVVGAALFAIVSIAGFESFVAPRSSTNVTVDVSRIASYVAPGIGFIGGGAILKYGGRVSGITTAASLWSGAAIGVAVGLGLWTAGLVAAAIAVVVLEVLKPVSRWVQRAGRRRRTALALEVRADVDLGEVIDTIRGHVDGDIRALRYGEGPGDARQLSIDLWRSPTLAERERLVGSLVGIEGVIVLDDTS